MPNPFPATEDWYELADALLVIADKAAPDARRGAIVAYLQQHANMKPSTREELVRSEENPN